MGVLNLVLLRKFLLKYEYPDIVFDFINLCCCVEAGLPILLIAPVGSGKSTLIQSIQKRYAKKYAVEKLARVSPMRLFNMQDAINHKKVLFVSEDFSSIGQDTDTTYKTVLVVAMLSYDKTYTDPLFKTKKHPKGLVLEVEQLAFLCGMQPAWLYYYTQKDVWKTIIEEKILRYYRLPIHPIKKFQPDMQILIEYLISLKFKNETDYEIEPYYKRLMVNALKVQCSDRAIDYAPRMLEVLKKFVSKEYINEWIRQYALRFRFEEEMIFSYYTTEFAPLPEYEVRHKDFEVLCNTLAFNPMTSKLLGVRLKIRGRTPPLTRQHVGFLIKNARELGYVYSIRFSKKIRLYPTKKFRKYSIYNWKPKRTETDITRLDVD